VIRKGDLAPDFTLKGSDDKDHRLSDYRGRKVVLIFYPLDFSPVCTKQHACVREDFQSFAYADAVVLGISVDSIWTHKAWAKEMKLTYPLLADFHPKGAVAGAYGVYNADRGNSTRATFVIDPEGRVSEVFHYEPGVVPETAPVLEALKTS
jgi:peroxiredoxin